MARVPQIAGKADVPEAAASRRRSGAGGLRSCPRTIQHPAAQSRSGGTAAADGAVRPQRATSSSLTLRFVGILATVREKDADYVWAAQVRVAREAGLSEASIDVLRAKGDIAALPPEERDVATYARQLVRNNRVDQSVFDTLQKRHGTKWLVELTAIMSFYGALCGVVNAFEVAGT